MRSVRTGHREQRRLGQDRKASHGRWRVPNSGRDIARHHRPRGCRLSEGHGRASRNAHADLPRPTHWRVCRDLDRIRTRRGRGAVTLTADRLDAYLADPVLLIAEQLILEDGRPFGECMASFQRSFFDAVFGTRADGTPTYRLVYDERRRGESKTEDCAAAALADLFTGPARHVSYAVAGDEEQAGLILDS